MKYDELIEKLERMSERATRHDYAVGDFWNAVAEAAEALRDLEHFREEVEDMSMVIREDTGHWYGEDPEDYVGNIGGYIGMLEARVDDEGGER
jgi:hypothetical protein